jgi:hypothetical protein
MMRTIIVLLVIAVSGCQNNFDKLLEDVKENCHTTIDAQVSGGMTGVGGSGRFTQECWPTKPIEVVH